jgi:hypothetical protein
MFCPKCGTQNPDNGRFCRNCGLTLNSAALEVGASGGELKLQDVYVDRRGRVRSNNPDDLWSGGIKMSIMGVGFLIVSVALLITNVAGGHAWWWAMLFPAFSMLAGGISNVAKAKRIEQKKSAGLSAGYNNQIPTSPANTSLPPTQNEYISPVAESRYKTGDLVPPSVVEATTRHLEMNSEDETIALPKK